MIDIRARRQLLRWLPLVLVPVLLLASTYPGQYRVPAHYWLLAMAAGVVFLAGARRPLAVSIVLSVLAVPMLRTPAWGVSGLVPYLGAVALVDVIARSHRQAPVWVATGAWAAAVVLGRVGLHDTSIGRASTVVEAAAYVGLPLLLGLYLRGQRDLAENLRLRAADAEARTRIDERAALARELHDVVAHHMASIILRISVAGHVVRTADPRVVAVLDDVRGTAADALADIRRLLAALRDPALGTVALVDPEAVATEITAALDRVRAAGFTVEAELEPDLDGLDAITRLTLLRLVQESLTNVMKHADQAVPVRFRLGRRDSGIGVDVVSGATATALGHGIGGGATDTPPGHGIVGMRERADLAGGTLAVGAEETSWAVRAWLPDRTGEPT
ncbi:sensor histidine kinase [Nocardia sp. NPDC058176]|uniref:sensor histidine kinase n=1 Tax=Nocardia sp. NPDC058176 TaxID=3346368 RepID=UPI0036DE3CD7